MFNDKKKLNLYTAIAFGVITVLALVSMTLRFTAYWLLFFLGAGLITAGLLIPKMKVLSFAGFGLSAIAALTELLTVAIGEAPWKYYAFMCILHPIVSGLLMIAVFTLPLIVCLKPEKTKLMGMISAGCAFAVMLLIVGCGFKFSARYILGVNYLEFLKWMIMIPAVYCFCLLMEGEEPVFKFQPKQYPAYDQNPYAAENPYGAQNPYAQQPYGARGQFAPPQYGAPNQFVPAGGNAPAQEPAAVPRPVSYRRAQQEVPMEVFDMPQDEAPADGEDEE